MGIIHGGRVINKVEFRPNRIVVGPWFEHIVERWIDGKLVFFSRETGEQLKTIPLKDWLDAALKKDGG